MTKTTCTSFVVSLLFRKMGGEGSFLEVGGGALILNFGRWEGHLFDGSVNLRGGGGALIRRFAVCVLRFFNFWQENKRD